MLSRNRAWSNSALDSLFIRIGAKVLRKAAYSCYSSWKLSSTMNYGKGEILVLYSLTWFCSAWRCHCPWRTARSRSSWTRSLWSERRRARFVPVRVSFPPPVAWFCRNTTWDRRNEESQSICNKLHVINTLVEDTKDWNLSNIHPLIGFKLRNIYHHLAIAHLWTWRFEIFMRLLQKTHFNNSRLCLKYPSMMFSPDALLRINDNMFRAPDTR